MVFYGRLSQNAYALFHDLNVLLALNSFIPHTGIFPSVSFDFLVLDKILFRPLTYAIQHETAQFALLAAKILFLC